MMAMAVSSQLLSMASTKGPAAAIAAAASSVRGSGVMGHGRTEARGSGRSPVFSVSMVNGSDAVMTSASLPGP